METTAYQGRVSNKSMGLAPKPSKERDVTGAHAPFLQPQLPVPSLQLSTTFVFTGASVIKITSSLFITAVAEQLELASSPMEDGVSVQGPAVCCVAREEGAEGVSIPHYLLLAARGAARCTNSQS